MMTKLNYRTKNGSSPKKKPKVYFSCHPDDFENTFEAVCKDIFKTHDCVIFYKEDMNDSLPEETREVDLGRMNLFVFPVTFKMLRGGNLAAEEDLAFAKREFKPILPILFEANAEAILPFYAKSEMFGERQFLNKFSHDLTEISFEEKLKKYLDSTLIDDDTAEKIRKTFDAYIFLSYRKKDRKYANELMQLIHKDPLCRNIAVWFDEFLTPGESFNASIEKALNDSRLVTLLVTPSLLETPNYVQQVEYPSAVQSGKTVLPAEKLPTDREKLKQNYQGLPDVIGTGDEDKFHQAFINVVKDIIHRESEHDPMHNYLIGLAYLDGIDVEININYGVELVTKAAEAELPEAMETLFDMYENGKYISLDYKKAVFWQEKIYQYSVQKYGEEHPDTLTDLHNLAFAYGNIGDYQKQLEINEKCYQLRCKVFGENNYQTLDSLNGLALAYSNLGNYEKSLEFYEKCYKIRCKVLGEEHPDTLITLENLSCSYGYLENYSKALELSQKSYKLQCKILGENHLNTLDSLNTIACMLYYLEKYEKALENEQGAYYAKCSMLGEEHPDTLTCLSNFSAMYRGCGNYEKAIELGEKCYKIQCKVIGENHPDTLLTLSGLATSYGLYGNLIKCLELNEKCYIIRCHSIGAEHPKTLLSLYRIGVTYGKMKNYNKSIEVLENCYQLRCKVLGEQHSDTIDTYNFIKEVKKRLKS